jgi:hypothetical protein
MKDTMAYNRIVPTLILTLGLLVAAAPVMAGPGDGTVLGATKVVDNGPDAERFNLVVLAEGFTAAQQSDFNSKVDQLVAAVFGYPPIDTMSSAINVTRVNVASDQSGADDPPECGTEGIFVDTYFDATYCAGGIHRALVVNNSTVFSVLNAWAPEWDQAVVVVNSTMWGGTGGSVSVISVATGWQGIVIHEMGHSAFGLADEYEYWAGCGADTDRDHHPAAEPAEPNVTIETNRLSLKWNDLVDPGTPIPTTENANCAFCDNQPNPLPDQTVGLYEGAHYYHCDAYRPQFNCMMRNLASYFCAVCRAEVENTLAAYLPHVNQPPVASCQPAVASADGTCQGAVQPEDIDDGSFDPDGDPLVLSLEPSGPYPLGETPAEFIASDGDAADTCPVMITVVDDTPPVANCPGDIEVNSGPGVIDTAITYTSTAADACPGVSVDCEPPSGSIFGPGTTDVRCIATDQSGNADTCMFTVTVVLSCMCPYQCDFDEDGFPTPLDLSKEIDILFSDDTIVSDPGCPTSRGDFDFDGFPTPLDLSGLIDHLYAEGPPPCDPCDPVQGSCAE